MRSKQQIYQLISQGRTEYFLDLMELDQWQELLHEGQVKPLQWLVYYNDLTALKLVLKEGGDLGSIDLNGELGNAAFFGHWKICEFLLGQGADVNASVDKTDERPLHNALAKAGRPYYLYTVRTLIEHGADVNVHTTAGIETGAFMRDVRTKGEAPLHRAAAYADEATIQYLLDNGAEKEAKDAYGNTPLSRASEHLRPGTILYLLQYGSHRISQKHVEVNKGDHGQGWGGMDWHLLGDFLPDDPTG